MEKLKRKSLCIFKSYFNLNIYKYNPSAMLLIVCILGGVQMKLITLYLPEPYIKALDSLVDERYYPNRAEAIRVAIRDLISVEVWRKNTNG